MTARLAVIGAGAIGSVHVGNIVSNPRAELIAVCDTNENAAKELIGTSGARLVTDLADVFPHLPDALVIASSTASHGAVARAALDHGIPFLCEKPLAYDLPTARNIALGAQAKGIAAAMAFNRRFDVQYAGIKQAVADGVIGLPESLNFVSRSARAPTPEFTKTSGGLLGEKGSHFYDLARWICNAEPTEVFAMGSVMVDPGFADVGEVDTAKITLRMPSGTLCQFDFSWRSVYGQDERLEVHGSGGMLSTRQAPTGPYQEQTAEGVRHPERLPGWAERFGSTYPAELDAFLDLLEDPARASSNLPTLQDGLAVQQIAEAAKQSIRENRPVRL